MTPRKRLALIAFDCLLIESENLMKTREKKQKKEKRKKLRILRIRLVANLRLHTVMERCVLTAWWLNAPKAAEVE